MPQSTTTTRNRISLSTGAGGKQSPLGWIGSLVLHGAIIAAILFTFTHTHTLEITDQSPPSIPVDLVTIGEKTNIMPTVRHEPRIKPDVQPTPITPKDLATPPPVVPVQQEQTQAAPPPDESTEPLPKAPPVPDVKPTPAPKKPAVDSVSALLNKLTAPAAAPTNAKVANRTVKGVGAMNAMVADLQDSLRTQVQQCWSPQIGAPNAADMVVDFDLLLNQDGSVAQPPQLTATSQAAAASNPYTRAAAEAARRAIMECAPYKLPADRYSQWHEINPFHFDPSQMMGQ
jgi:outer membrane biosynthesis protein TonB